MTNTTLLTEALHDWSQEVAVPHDLAERALTGRRQVRRRRAVPLLAGLATAAAVAVAVTAAGSWGPLGDAARQAVPAFQDDLAVSADTTHQPPETLVAAGDIAVSAIVTASWDPVGTDGWETLHRHYAVLDPSSGRYRATDWSAVSVAPGLGTAAVLEGDLPASRIGILDLDSGEVTRWIPTDHPVASLAWSADGSHVVATAYDADPDLQKPTGNDSFRLADTRRTGFVLVDPEAGTASFTSLPNREMNVGRADVGFTADGQAVWSPSGTPDELFFDLDGLPSDGRRENLNANLGVDAAALPITSPDGRFTITRDSGLPTAITDTDTGHEYRQPALQVLGWADDEHVVTLAGCSDPCKGTDEFKNGLVLMRYDGTDRVPLTGTRKGSAGDWYFQLTPR